MFTLCMARVVYLTCILQFLKLVNKHLTQREQILQNFQQEQLPTSARNTWKTFREKSIKVVQSNQKLQIKGQIVPLKGEGAKLSP